MSIVKPHKLGIITGPGSEYLSGKIVKHLRGLYVERYHKLSKNLAYRYGMTEEEILREVTFIDDLGNKKIPSGKCPTEFNNTNRERHSRSPAKIAVRGNTLR